MVMSWESTGLLLAASVVTSSTEAAMVCGGGIIMPWFAPLPYPYLPLLTLGDGPISWSIHQLLSKGLGGVGISGKHSIDELDPNGYNATAFEVAPTKQEGMEIGRGGSGSTGGWFKGPATPLSSKFNMVRSSQGGYRH